MYLRKCNNLQKRLNICENVRNYYKLRAFMWISFSMKKALRETQTLRARWL